MSICIVTGSGGLIGSEAVRHFIKKYDKVIGIDNDFRSYMFGDEASTKWSIENHFNEFKKSYIHENIDIRNEKAINELFKKYGNEIKAIIHCAACPSHDWAKKEPLTDFTVNALGTMILLEATRAYCPEAAFVFCSTNKVYGDTPNRLPLIQEGDRFVLDPKQFGKKEDSEYGYYLGTSLNGITEEMSIDNSTHSLFGCSKVAADVMVQEYGKYFGMNTVAFRGGCLTGGGHSGAELHGFLSYLGKCVLTGKKYTVFGRKGLTIRDNIHSSDVISAFEHYIKNPRAGEVYNLGGNTYSNCSMKEAINAFQELTGKQAIIEYVDDARVGDHMWYISDMSKFQVDYPLWKQKYDINMIYQEIIDSLNSRM